MHKNNTKNIFLVTMISSFLMLASCSTRQLKIFDDVLEGEAKVVENVIEDMENGSSLHYK